MLKQTFMLGALLFGLTACQSSANVANEPVPLEGSWHIEMVLGQATVDYSPAQLTFAADGKLAGNNSCNQIFGQYQQQGEQLTLTTGGTTRRACVNALMMQENKVMKALPQVTKAKLDGGRLSLLNADNTTVLLLSPLKQ
ncbi:META domain-containing protein [Shewanella sp. A25]|nr:META domain-containing protein [Shewanella shenzhenensis]